MCQWSMVTGTVAALGAAAGTASIPSAALAVFEALPVGGNGASRSGRVSSKSGNVATANLSLSTGWHTKFKGKLNPCPLSGHQRSDREEAR